METGKLVELRKLVNEQKPKQDVLNLIQNTTQDGELRTVSSIDEHFYPIIVATFYGHDISSDPALLEYLSQLVSEKFGDMRIFDMTNSKSLIFYENETLNKDQYLPNDISATNGDLCLFNSAILPLYYVFGRKSILDRGFFRAKGKRSYFSAADESKDHSNQELYRMLAKHFLHYEDGLSKVANEHIFPGSIDKYESYTGQDLRRSRGQMGNLRYSLDFMPSDSKLLRNIPGIENN